MRSRLAILGMLVFGMVLSTGGAGLAVSGFSSPSGNAALQQYGKGNNGANPQADDQGDTLGEEDSGGPGPGQDDAGGSGDEGGTAGADDSQPARQVEAGAQASGGDDEELPFTGFAAIPILLGGVALLSTGLVMRRRTGDDA